jgi:hypothetical protein
MSEAARVLGVSDEVVDIDERATLAALSLAMASQCSRQLDIVSRHLDPPIYDDDDFVAAVKGLALGSRRARIRLLVTDTRPLLARGHRLLDLAARLSSFIALRVPAPVHKDFNEAILLADNQGYIHRRHADRFEGNANFSDRRTCAALSERFEEMWERGAPDPNFRRLHI